MKRYLILIVIFIWTYPVFAQNADSDIQNRIDGARHWIGQINREIEVLNHDFDEKRLSRKEKTKLKDLEITYQSMVNKLDQVIEYLGNQDVKQAKQVEKTLHIFEQEVNILRIDLDIFRLERRLSEINEEYGRLPRFEKEIQGMVQIFEQIKENENKVIQLKNEIDQLHVKVKEKDKKIRLMVLEEEEKRLKKQLN